MLKILFIIVWFAIVVVTGTNISYTVESFTVDEKLCMTDCVDDECFTGKSNVRCIPGDKPALTYYTSQQRSQHKHCLSRCGNFAEKDYNWCFVSEDEWDHCNPERGWKIYEDIVFTETMGPCEYACEKGFFGDRWCSTYWGSWDWCEPYAFTYVQSKTVYGKECPAYCGRHGNVYNWCIDVKEKSEPCAPPGRDFSLFGKMFRKCMIAENCRPCHMLAERQGGSVINIYICKDDKCDIILESGYVSTHVELLERQGNYLVTQNVDEKGNSVYRFTVMPQSLFEDPILPLLVRARVTKNHLNPLGANQTSKDVKKNLERMGMNVNRLGGNNDKDGHLIAHILGGPNKIYNIAPQTLRNEWDETQSRIHNFVRDTGGSADITILVIYHDLPRTLRPDGFAVNIALYYANNALHEECNDKYYSNHADAQDS